MVEHVAILRSALHVHRGTLVVVDHQVLRDGLVRRVEDERLVRRAAHHDALEAALRAAAEDVQMKAVLAEQNAPAVAHVHVVHRHQARVSLRGDDALPALLRDQVAPVSYTHLTLPTICSV